MSLSLRVSTIDDEAIVAGIVHRSYSELMASAYDPGVLRSALSAITRPNPALLNSGRYFIVSDNGQPAGCGGWSEKTPGSGEIIAGMAHIRHFAVIPEAAGKGVGKLLYTRCRDDAAVVGFRRFQVYSSLNAVPFYEKLGFVRIRAIDVPITDEVDFPSVILERDIVPA
ncbi:MAG: GNAT family N-acetyltransferase [Alphaproteobacteria bacterium]